MILTYVKRRNLTAAQRAIAAAEAWDQVPKLGTDEKGRETLAKLFDASKNYVQQARALLERDPDAAAKPHEGMWVFGRD